MSNIKVAVRVRPINRRELDRNGKVIVETNGDNVNVTNIKVDSQAEYGDSRERVKTFSFDYCYDSTGEPQSSKYTPQQVVFQDLGTEILQAAFEGYNACVFAYGQTSTGKTFTMTGSGEDPGLIPRICEGLFSHVDDFEASENITFRINISYLEIYNERVRDLLRPSLSQRNEKYTLKVREHPKEGPYVQDLSSHVVKDNEQIQTLLDSANENRTTASTYMHDHSSRSHAIVTVTFIQAKLDDDLPHEIVSKIHLVDLAGSERADPNWSLNYKGRLKEGSNINKSLVTLGNVIKSLAERSILSWSTDSLGSTQSFVSSGGGEGRASPFTSPKRARLPYIPYRDSVLTWLLKDSLGGNSKTIMIATISPASICYNETISTLRYAQRAKNIVNKPKVNEDASVTLIRELRMEIDRLKQMLAVTQMGFYPHNDVMYVVPFQKTQGEAEGLVALKDSDSALEMELQRQEDRANKLTQTWIDKWMETHEIIKESDLSITGLHRKTSSMGVLIDSQMPHLIGMDSDILSTGVVIYHLKDGKTLVGREDAKREQDIVLSGPGIQREHCYIKNIGGSVTLYPNRGSHCTVNGLECKNPVLLKQGDSVILGKTQMFRFNNPAEAAILRERRASQENILELEESESCTMDWSVSPMDQPHRPPPTSRVPSLYASTEFCLQLENQYLSETEKIEKAKEELEKLKEEHEKAEEERQMREEELWMTHNKHLSEIEDERKRLNKLKEEICIQRQKAEQDLQYGRECLEKEKEAFYKDLQGELLKLKSLKTTEELNDDFVFSDGSVTNEVVAESIRRRKQSLEGQLKTVIQKEIVKSFSHRQTEKTLQKQTEDLEDEFELSRHQVENQLGKIREIEEQYRRTDADNYTEINRTEEQLKEIQRREEQLELYIEEKQDLLNVKTDRPRPLRTACSAEILTNLEIETEFSEKTSSMLALNRGSVGDLPAISHQFSLSSMASIDSETSDSELIRDKSKATSKFSQITSDAKSVTNRLYQKTTPKFKYEPKARKKAQPLLENKGKRRKASPTSNVTPHQDTKGHSSSRSTTEPQTLARKRHTKSSTSLASVPEALAEDEQIMHSTPDVSTVVRRRNKRRTLEDEFRRHSEPAGDTLAEAFEQYMEMEKSEVDNSNTKQTSYVPQNTVSNRTVPLVLVSDHTECTYQDKEIPGSQGQECNTCMVSTEVPKDSDKGQQLCYITRDSPVADMECDPVDGEQSSDRSYKNCVDDKIAINITQGNMKGDKNMDKLTNFQVDIVPFIDVSFSEGESLPPIIPTASQNFKASDPHRPSHSGMHLPDHSAPHSTRDRSDSSSDDSSEHVIKPNRKRESKSQKVSSPPKMPKSDNTNYEWLVNAFSRLSEENLLDFNDEDNDSKPGKIKSKRSENKHNIDDQNDTNTKSVSSDSRSDSDEDMHYYSDSLEDSTDGSRPDVEDERDSLSEDDQVPHSDHDNDILSGEQPLSDYDELDDDYDDEDRREMYIEYPSDFPGSLLYSIREESVPASPVEEVYSPDVTDTSAVDNYLSQVVVLGQDNQALVTKVDQEHCHVNVLESDAQQEYVSDTNSPNSEQAVRSETCVELTADLNTVIKHSEEDIANERDLVNSSNLEQQGNVQVSNNTSECVNFIPQDSPIGSDVLVVNTGGHANVVSHGPQANTCDSRVVEDTLDLYLADTNKVKAPVLSTAQDIENYLSSVASALDQAVTVISDSNKVTNDASYVSASSLDLGSSSKSNQGNHDPSTHPSHDLAEHNVDNVQANKTCKLEEKSTGDGASDYTKPETRSLGVSTGPDLVNVSCGEDINSDDSLQEVQDELLVLQEAMDNQSARSAVMNGSSLSSARKATRKRAMEKRGSGVGTESEDLMSDDFPESQKPPPSRPDSASRRKKKPNNKPVDRTGKWTKEFSSDECVTSESDSAYSDDSRKHEDKRKEIPHEIAQQLTDTIDELTEAIAQSNEFAMQNMENDMSNGYSDEDPQYIGKMSAEINGTYVPNLELSDTEFQSSGNEHLNDRQRMSWRSSESSEGHSLRSTSETRDVSQQTDSSEMCVPERSPMSTQTERGMFALFTVAPISTWNSVDKCIKSPQGHSDSSNDESSNRKKLQKTKKCKLSDLTFTEPDTWSSDVYDICPCVDADMESGSESDADAVVMETETCSPATPSTHDHFFESAYTVVHDPPSKIHAPVKYEVTIKPEETNIMYNVEKTEYKSYGLQSADSEQVHFPESINVNITDRTSHLTENRHETVNRQQFQINQATTDSPSGNIVSERTFRANRELSSQSSPGDLEVRSERSYTEEDAHHFVETTCENPPVEMDKAAEYLSPRESVTSDYGTMIYDRRRGVSAAYDSDGKYVESQESNTMKSSDGELNKSSDNSDMVNGTSLTSSDRKEGVNSTAQQQASLQPSQEASTTYHDSSRSSEDIYVSADISRTSSTSSDYKTPQQSPQKEEIENIGRNVLPHDQTVRKNLDEDIKMLKTVSVNTESEQNSEHIRETLKSELQKKIDDLKYSRKNRDDSAFSSDYTDGDSVSVSPRTSFHESDKPSRLMPHPVEIRTTKTETTFEPSTGAQSYLPKLVDIDNKSVQKTPLKDSGNVFDDDYEELISETMEYSSPNSENLSESETVTGNEHHKSACIENEMFEDKDSSDRSLSPGEVVTDELYEQFASGLNSVDDMDIENEEISDTMEKSSTTCQEAGNEGRNSAELLDMMHSQQFYMQKSPSLSNIRSKEDVKDYRRSVSENCIDQYEEATSPHSSSSNDSIVFVFMGQSHTQESMEQLKHYTSKQREYTVHDSDENILSQNQDEDDGPSYGDDDTNDLISSLDSNEEMIRNMEEILSNEGIDSSENSPEPYDAHLHSQEISEPDDNETSEVFDPDSQEVSEHLSNMDKLSQSADSNSQSSELKEGKVENEISASKDRPRYNSENEEPLRHRFGIDESILPIPTRSVSNDNLPRKTNSRRTMHRSRSTSLLDVERKDTSSDNEGIFPPNVERSSQDSADFETREMEFSETDNDNIPSTPAPSVVDDTENNTQPSLSQDVLYSSLIPLQQSQIDYNGNIEGMSHNMSVGTQMTVNDGQTQTDTSVLISADGQIVHLLPGLDSPLRAQSMQTLQDRITQFNISEDSQNWYNLSSLMLETLPLLKNINQRLPGADISQSNSVENGLALETRTLATQTSTSLEKIDGAEPNKNKSNIVAIATQTSLSDESNLSEHTEVCVQTDSPNVMETHEISIQTDLLWSTATTSQLSGTADTLTWNLQGEQQATVATSSTVPLFSVDRDIITQNQTSTGRTSPSVGKEEDTCSVSSEEMYTEQCVMFYDFVNKCYVQNVESCEWQKINHEKRKENQVANEMKPTETSTDISEILSHTQTGEQTSSDTNMLKEESVDSHSISQNDGMQIDHGVRIHPKYSEYVYRTSSKQPEQRVDQKTSVDTITSSYASVQNTDRKTIENLKFDDQVKDDDDSENWTTEEVITYYEFPEQVETINDEISDNTAVNQGYVNTERTKSNKEVTTESKGWYSKPESSSSVKNVASRVQPQDKVIEETVSLTIPETSFEVRSIESPQEEVIEEVINYTKPQSSNAEKSPVQSPTEEITEEIVYYTLPTRVDIRQEDKDEKKELYRSNMYNNDKTSMSQGGVHVNGGSQVKGDVQVNGGAQVKGGVHVNGGSQANGGEQVSGGSQVKGDVQVRGGVQVNGGAQVKGDVQVRGAVQVNGAKQVKEGAQVNGGVTETTDGTKLNASSILLGEPSAYKSPYKQRVVMEKFVDVDDVVEDIVSPRTDDRQSDLSVDLSHQGGFRQHTNSKSSSSSSSQNSQNDSSQQSSQTGQSEAHSYQSKIVKRRLLDDKGDEESDDEDKNEVFEQVSEHHHHKQDDTHIQTILTEREHVMETEFYVPDIEASQAEMDALKEEHDKTMAAIKKAAEERKQRTEDLKNKTKKVIETEVEMTKEIENFTEDLEKRQNESKQVKFDLNAVETREFSIVSEDNDSKEDLAEKTSQDDYIYRSQIPSKDETERKLQRLENVFKSYVKLEQELKKEEEAERKANADLVDDVLSDSEESKYKKNSQMKPLSLDLTKVESDHVEKLDRHSSKFIPTYSLNNSDRRPSRQEEVMKYSVSEVSSTKKPDVIISNTELRKKPSNEQLEKVPVPEKSYKKPVISRSFSVDTNAKHPGTRNMGVEVSVDSSDDYTQTEGYDLHEPVRTGQRKDMSSSAIKSELDRLHKERVEIIELLALNYLPSSLTVEMLEAKLNYCIGQTDLLLDSLDDMWNVPEYIDERHVVTKEYLTKYREDLRKSKKDLKICKEQIDIKSGKGRGRPIGRKMDLQRLRRQAEIEAFKAERKLEQQNFNTVKSLNKLNGTLDAPDEKIRSAILQSSSRVRTMTPSEHAAYLIKLRKQVVKATEKEDIHYRISRSCSPFVGNKYQREYNLRSSSLQSPGLTHQHVSEPVEYGQTSYSSYPNYSLDNGYSYETQSLASESLSYRSASYDRRMHQTLAPPSYHSRSMSPNLARYNDQSRTMSRNHPSRRMDHRTHSRDVYSLDESQQLLREVQEARQSNQMEILKAEETLNSYNRYGTNSSTSYSAYTSDLLNTSNMSGSYELYDDQSLMTTSRSSSCWSLDRDSDSVHSNQRYELGMFHSRPIRSSDIKSRIMRQRKPRT